VLARPVPDPGLGQRLGQQALYLEYLDAALAHVVTERVMFLLGSADPQDVVEEQLLGVRRGQPRVFQARPVNHHSAQPTDFRVHSQRHFAASSVLDDGSPCLSEPARRLAWCRHPSGGDIRFCLPDTET